MDRSVLWLDEPGAADARLSGAKASNLAVARQHGLPVFDGFVVTATPGRSPSHRSTAGRSELRDAWARLSRDGELPLAVRSSSVLEDSAESSMAGQFLTVLHVRGWDAFVAALADVFASASSVPDSRAPEAADVPAPMAVLVQPMSGARHGGVLFGVDPLTGDRSRLLVSAVRGLPDQIVSGEATGQQFLLNRRGAVRPGRRASQRRRTGRSGTGPAAEIGPRDRRSLARLARSAERLFGAPQDIEWLIDDRGDLHMLQSRPITASALPPHGGHLLGSGPVAETFPDPLARLERDLWEEPLDTGIREALRLSGAVSSRALADRFVVDVGGRVAVDLESLGVVSPPRTWWRVLDPRPPARRVLAAWRMGHLRIALPAIAHDLVCEVDGDLRSLAALDQLGDVQLLTVISNAQRTLAALHAHEVLCGFFVDADLTTATGASVALTTLARARLDGLSDTEIIALHPVVLALLTPSVGGPRTLPPALLPTESSRSSRVSGVASHDPAADAMGVAREALRLRVRWVQELTAQVAMELGSRLASRRQLCAAVDVRHLDLAELRDAVEFPGSAVPLQVEELDGPPLPARFRLAADGSVVPDATRADDGTGGVAAGPVGVSSGRVVGTVTHDPLDATAKILVVRTLDPALAGAVEVAAGLVAENGSPLSHLAILAREYGVPAVAAMSDATLVLHDGDRVLLDGTAGTVDVVDAVEVVDAREVVDAVEMVDGVQVVDVNDVGDHLLATHHVRPGRGGMR